jgi:hypothetical protein
LIVSDGGDADTLSTSCGISEEALDECWRSFADADPSSLVRLREEGSEEAAVVSPWFVRPNADTPPALERPEEPRGDGSRPLASSLWRWNGVGDEYVDGGGGAGDDDRVPGVLAVLDR